MVARSERWLTAVAEAGCVIDVCGSIRMPRQAVLTANVERVPLVVVEQAEAGGRRGAGSNKTACNAAETERQLIGIGQIKLCTVINAWRAQGKLPPIDGRALDGEGEKEI